MTIYITRTCTPEYLEGFDHAVIHVTKELAQTVMRRRKAFLEAARQDSDLSRHEYRDYSAAYLPYNEQIDELFVNREDDIVTAPADFVLDEDAVERTDWNTMMLGEFGVRFACAPKHVDGREVETTSIPFSIFESEL